MKTSIITAAGVAAALAVVGTASADTQFQPQTCVLTLSPSYSADAFGNVAVEVPNTALACPGFAFDPAVDDFNGGELTNAVGQQGPAFLKATLTYYDATANGIVTKNVLKLSGSISAPNPVTYDRWSTSPSGLVYGNPVPYVTHNTLNYRVQFAGPTTITSSVPAAPTCTIALKSKYTWRWNQANYWVIPDSAIRCTGTTFSAATMSAFIPLQSRQQNQGSLVTSTVQKYDPATGQMSSTRQLRLRNQSVSTYDQVISLLSGGLGGAGSFARENGILPPPSAAANAVIWGRFRVQTQSDFLPPFISDKTYEPPQDVVAGSNKFVRFVSKGPITIKRATDVTLKSHRVDDGAIRLSITADRNWSFQNTVAPTYRRQTVLPATPADHAVLRRGNRVLRKVRLSPYGTASVTVEDIPGRNRYSVTMVETDDNFQGSASVRA